MRNVLIIDDSLTVRMDLDEAFASAGWGRTLCSTAAAAREALREGRFDLIILDVVLPDANGIDLLAAFKQNKTSGQIPVILLSTQAEVGGQLKALASGVEAYVGKPYDRNQLLTHAERLAQRPSPATGGTILAVDDSATYLHALAEQLRKDNYNLVLARSGAEALDLLAVWPVDCILLDLMMPEMSGQEMCRRIKASPAWRLIPVVMLTGTEERNAMIESFNAGADDFVSKSGDLAVLRARLRAQVRRRKFEEETRRIREELHQKELEIVQARVAGEMAQKANKELEKRVEERTAALQEAVGELQHFSYTITHDMRAPLRAMCGYGEMLLEKSHELPPASGILIKRITIAAERMDRLITDALDYSKLVNQQLELQPVDCRVLIEGMIDSYPQYHESKTGIRIEGTIPAILGNGAALTQCFSNLLNNAIKFVKPGQSPHVRIRAEERGECVRIWFEDNGIGIPPDCCETIFLMFQRLNTKHEGTGIGLALVKKAAERMGGTVGVESEPGQGSRFWLEFKKAAAQPSSS